MAAARAVVGEVNGDGDDGGRAGKEDVGKEAGGRGGKTVEGAGRSRVLAKSLSSPHRWLLCARDRE